MSAPVVLRKGYLRKLKSRRRKWFVLYGDSPEASARLEYHSNEKKFQAGHPPKRSISLKTCFNINRLPNSKYKHVIALYTKDDCFSILLDSEEEAEEWLSTLITLQHGEEGPSAGEHPPRPSYEHVWQVIVLNRGLGACGIIGRYSLCLTDKTLSLIKKNSDEPGIDLNLSNIRSCGSLGNFFFLEVGRSSPLGGGQLWMETEESEIAANMHQIIFHAMSNNSTNELAPKSRNRSSSATESSKPAVNGKGTHSGTHKNVLTDNSPHSNESQAPTVVTATSNVQTQHPTGGAAWSGTISHQRTQSLPLAHPAPLSDHSNITSQPPRAAKRPNQSSKCSIGGRERCDSMPTRARTTSEGNPIPISRHLAPHRMYPRDISHSPPSGSPVSPPSVGCSTDSTGSSYSLADEADVNDHELINRYNHSLTPEEAIAEEDLPDSSSNIYLPMSRKEDGYVDMSPRGRNNTISPTASVSSVTSGTPSTDLRFTEYPLEKVTSYFPPSSEDEESRPARAYSVGSRPESYIGKNLMEVCHRVRAFSVGSKTKKGPMRVLPHYSHPGVKSSSAPILSTCRLHSSSHGSIGPMDDLMEMDFSRSNSGSNSGYMEMRPGASQAQKTSGYVEMKPGFLDIKPEVSPYVDMSGSSPAKNSSTYLNLNYNNNNYNKISCSPTKSPSKEKWLEQYSIAKAEPATSTVDGYVEMNLGKHQRQSSLDGTKRINVNEDYTDMTVGQWKGSKKDKRTEPINIQGQQKHSTPDSSSSTGGFIEQLLRHCQPEQEEKGSGFYLPLNSGSLPRQRTWKNIRRDSKDSSSSSVTTPSSSSTIFPLSLNSPLSPAKKESPVIKVPQGVLNTPYKPKGKSVSVSEDYTMMDFEAKKDDDYVHFNPAKRIVKTEDSGDYAFMRPGALEKTAGSTMCFRPINESNKAQDNDDEDKIDEKKVNEKSRPSSVGSEGSRNASRPSSTSSELCSSSSTLVGSRPESVNSDRVRPASGTAEVQLHYASLDLAPAEEEGSRSPRTGEGNQDSFLYAEIDFMKSKLSKV